MRSSEWIQAGFALIVACAAWAVPLSRRRRQMITWLALITVFGISLARALDHLAPVQNSIARDWLPLFFMLMFYWQTGRFFIGPNQKLQAWLVASDQRFFRLLSQTGWAFGRSARLSMEWAYALCYAIVPAGLTAFYFAGLRQHVQVYWFLVLVPTYICYAVTPFFPALPPRSLVNGKPASTSKSRTFNLWLAKYGSIQAISFPSAHVASSLGVSLAVLHYLPLAGTVFLAVTFWIAVAAVVERYHYTVDVVLGASVSLAVYLVWRAGWFPRGL